MALPLKRQRFVDEFLVDLNRKQAAIRAGFSPKTAETQGSRLYRNVHVRAAIDKALEERAERYVAKQGDVLYSIHCIAKEARDAGEYAAALKGYELLGKHLRLFAEKIEITGRMTLEQLVLGAVPPPEPSTPSKE